jgi:hypothetical protein
VMGVQDKETAESLESFLNLGADEVDIRTIQGNFTVGGRVRPEPFEAKLRNTYHPWKAWRECVGAHSLVVYVAG